MGGILDYLLMNLLDCKQFFMKYETLCHRRETLTLKQKQVVLLEKIAENLTEALVFKQRRDLLDYFAQWETFWGTCSVWAMLGVWVFVNFVVLVQKQYQFSHLVTIFLGG